MHCTCTSYKRTGKVYEQVHTKAFKHILKCVVNDINSHVNLYYLAGLKNNNNKMWEFDGISMTHQ